MPFALVLRPASPLSHARFAAQVRGLARGASALALTQRPPPRGTIPALSREPLAVLVVDALPTAPFEGLRREAYRVETTTPIEAPARPAGERRPAMVTLFRRRAGLDDATFVARWQEGHSPLAMAVHPLVGYVRHRVREAVDEAPRLDGIVLEEVPREADLLRPWRYFGGALAMVPNMVRVGLDARGFLDLGTIENALVEVEEAG